MKHKIKNKTYGEIIVLLDDEISLPVPLSKLNIEYNKSKKNYYVYFCLSGKKYRLHRYLMGEPHNLVVDHINGDTLDNRKQNLRTCTQKENTQNRMDSIKFLPTTRNKLGIRGLQFLYDKRDKRWYYKFKLKGYCTRYFCLSKKQEAIDYARNPERI